MTSFKLRATVAAVAGVALFGLAAGAKADSTDDLLKKLRDKGILSEQEYNDFNNTRDSEQEQKAKEKSALNKGKIKIGKWIDNATLYGDIRARFEHRDGEDAPVAGATPISQDRDRERYKITFGIKTEASNFFYTDLAFAMGGTGRSDNATFGNSRTNGNDKEGLFVKRAMIGWHGTDWLTVEAGRVENPLYTTEMVWDKDLTLEGLVEKLEYSVGKVDLFANLTQSAYLGDKKNYSNSNISGNGNKDINNNFLLAFQGGAKAKLTDELSVKAALTYYTYTHDRATGTTPTSVFMPGLGTSSSNAITTANTVNGVGTITAYGPIAGLGNNLNAINDLRILELPFEFNYAAMGSKYTFTAFGDFARNLDGNDRRDAACNAIKSLPAVGGGAAKPTNTQINTLCSNSDNNAWLLGLAIKSGGKEAAAGDWQAKLWYQSVGLYSLDPNTPDSDFMDSRLNMKGVVFKGMYNIEDNVLLNLSAGHASRKDKNLAATTSGTSDLSINVDDYNLYQIDLTYKF
jgi:hypothetical protein